MTAKNMKTDLTKHITDSDLRGIPEANQIYGRRMRRREFAKDAAVMVGILSLAYYVLSFLFN